MAYLIIVKDAANLSAIMNIDMIDIIVLRNVEDHLSLFNAKHVVKNFVDCRVILIVSFVLLHVIVARIVRPILRSMYVKHLQKLA